MKILVVDDEPAIVDAVSVGFTLEWEDCQVLPALDGETALRLFFDEQPDIVILDIGLPDIDGFDVLRRIRHVSEVPILFLSARDREIDKVKGLELGADDYVTKPFGYLELIARTKAVLRRTEMPAPVPAAPSLVVGDLQINFASHAVALQGQPVKLTPIEYNLLFRLARNAGRVLPHETLLAKVWGEEYRSEVDYLKVYINRLRAKLHDDPENPRFIFTERGVGYRFARPSSQGC